MTRSAIALVATLLTCVAAGQTAVPGENDIWELSRSDTQLRWLIIHNLAEGKETGVFHVEILERNLEDPAWRFTRLAAHMAVTAEALRASVTSPRDSGRVYPEHFREAFARWRAQEGEGTAPVCRTSVLDCLESLSE